MSNLELAIMNIIINRDDNFIKVDADFYDDVKEYLLSNERYEDVAFMEENKDKIIVE